ncbi:pentapeptide repeat-containing protein [Amycolatopsis sp. NPDC048633]|uniref:pentapeptide repeat-containing protein n=1 Tax=Amycolatopsis sp. NPDC048633 TaxID=3157095 RepID=UPI00340D4F8D
MTVLFGWVDWPGLGRWARPHAVPLVLFGAAAVCVAVGMWLLRNEQAPRPPAARMSWWVVTGAAVVVIVVAWAATSWLYGEAAAAKDPGAAKADAIKTGLGIGAGTTGIFALLLAVRRQWHNELDAAEKNVTELYIKAADQLGSDQAPVRLAGLYALERLAHNNLGQRQSIVNVLCAYLRMPYTPPDETLPLDTDPGTQRTDHQSRVQEREVRLAAQRILTDHLRPADRGEFWDGIDLDLSNAQLINFDLRAGRVSNGRFVGATFTGDALFGEATFSGAWFVGATFSGDARFQRATFTTALFDGATFTAGALFREAAITGDAIFRGATFIGNARFQGAIFTCGAWFSSSTFTGDARFHGATFTGDAYFGGAVFTGDAWFDGATFSAAAQFEATFARRPSFEHATMNAGLTGLQLGDDKPGVDG